MALSASFGAAALAPVTICAAHNILLDMLQAEALAVRTLIVLASIKVDDISKPRSRMHRHLRSRAWSLPR